ncbi:MAG: shikimate kinase [Candidatus Brockarchaeota archaeon]|nr:shikimate kinase [Candidatus Brockarchaeota archaeon]
MTIVNAMANYLGAALGIDIHVKARARAEDGSGKIRAAIPDGSCGDTSLVNAAARVVLERFGPGKDLSVEVRSEIPVARGLKSSSAVSNAVVLACSSALGLKLPLVELVKMGVEAAFRAKVTVTGAFDDASASMLGGATVTDNKSLKLLRRFRVDGRLRVVLLVPPSQSFSGKVDVGKVKPLSEVLALAHSLALRKKLWIAMTLNGLACSDVFGCGGEAALAALGAGALGAGLSGKGPSVAAVVEEGGADRVREALEAFEGDLMVRGINNERAKVS